MQKQLSTMINDADNNTNNSTLLFNCRFLLRQLGDPPLIHIYRKQNRLVDSLARNAISTAQPSFLSVASASTASTVWLPPQDVSTFRMLTKEMT